MAELVITDDAVTVQMSTLEKVEAVHRDVSVPRSAVRSAWLTQDGTVAASHVGTHWQGCYFGSKFGGMAATKYSASMDDGLLADARADARDEGLTLSGWLAGAAADRLRLNALRRLVDEWEAEHGAVGAAELDALEDKLAGAHRAATQRRTAAGAQADKAAS